MAENNEQQAKRLGEAVVALAKQENKTAVYKIEPMSVGLLGSPGNLLVFAVEGQTRLVLPTEDGRFAYSRLDLLDPNGKSTSIDDAVKDKKTLSMLANAILLSNDWTPAFFMIDMIGATEDQKGMTVRLHRDDPDRLTLCKPNGNRIDLDAKTFAAYANTHPMVDLVRHTRELVNSRQIQQANKVDSKIDSKVDTKPAAAGTKESANPWA